MDSIAYSFLFFKSFCECRGKIYELKSPLSPHPALAAAGISPAPVTHSCRHDQAEKAQKQPPRNSTGAAFTYSISIFQSGFETAAKAIKELNTRFHRLSPNAHPNKSGVIFPAFIGFYRDITKAIYNPLRPCNTPYKRLYHIGGYKIAACAAVLFLAYTILYTPVKIPYQQQLELLPTDQYTVCYTRNNRLCQILFYP